MTSWGKVNREVGGVWVPSLSGRKDRPRVSPSGSSSGLSPGEGDVSLFP